MMTEAPGPASRSGSSTSCTSRSRNDRRPRAPGRDAGSASVRARFDLLDRRRRRDRRRDRARRGAARAGRRARRRGRLRGRDVQPVVQADPRRAPLPAVRRPAAGVRGARRAAQSDAHGAPPVPADRVRLPWLPRRDARRWPRWASASRLYNALALWRPPARGRKLSARRALRADAAAAQRRPRGRAGLRRLPDRRRAPGARERPGRRGGRRDDRQPCSRHHPAARWPRPRPRRRARGRRDRRAARGARHASCSARPDRSPTASSPTAARTACARRWACTSCSTPRACRTTAARWCCARRATTACSSCCPPAPRTIIGTTDTDWPSPEPPRIDDDIRARGDDVAYLLEAVNHCISSAAPRRRTTCCPPTRGCGRCSPRAPTRRRRRRASTTSRAPPTACW